MAKFKVGDRVKRTQNQHQGMNPGNIGTIIEIDYSDSNNPDFFLKEYNEGKGRHNCAVGGFELVEQTYTKLTPKVGDKLRVINCPRNYNDNEQLFAPGQVITVKHTAASRDVRFKENSTRLMGKKYLTTEYLEPVEEEKEWSKMQMKDIERFEKHSTPTRLTTNIYEHHRNIQKELNKTNQTTMQKLTSALKRVLSADKQTLYKVGVIGQDLTLTSSGRNEYIDALFENEGDHKKAVTQMVEDAQEYLDEEKD